MTYHKPYCLTFDADVQAGTPVHVPDITSRNWANRPTVDAEVMPASSSPTFIAFMARKVLGELSTYAIPTVLDETGAQGLCVESTTQTGVKYYEQLYDDCGSAQAGSVHRSLLTSLGRVVPDSIDVDHQGNARLNFRVIPIKKTAVDIIVVSDVEALPTITVAAARFTLGKLTVAGTVLTRYTSWRLDFGNLADGRATQSEIDDELIEHTAHAPMLTVRGIDPTQFPTTIPIGGAAAAHADTIFYLRKRSQNAANFVPDVTAQHIKFTMYGLGAMDDLAAGGEITRPTENSLIIKAAIDTAGNAPLSINTASAIT